MLVRLLAFDLGYPGRHGYGGNAGGTDQGVDLLFQKQIHELGHEHPPPTVLKAKATRPRIKMKIGWGLRKASAFIVAPTDSPRNMVAMDAA